VLCRPVLHQPFAPAVPAINPIIVLQHIGFDGRNHWLPNCFSAFFHVHPTSPKGYYPRGPVWPGQCWQLAGPGYAGGQPTQLRARLRPGRGRGKSLCPDLYSNPFVGSAQPAQFWQTEGHSQQNITVPYFN
jgi:hypothetical protein